MILLLNMGVPMIMPTMFFMVLALIPIVLIESWYVSRALGIRFSGTVSRMGMANVVSTLVGLPFTWLLLFIVQIITGGLSSYGVNGVAGKILAVTLQAPWLLPFEPEEFWMFHSAALFLLIPFFFATWFIEYVIVRNKLSAEVVEPEHTTDDLAAQQMVFKAVGSANLLSYGLIAILLVGSLIWLAIGGQ